MSSVFVFALVTLHLFHKRENYEKKCRCSINQLKQQKNSKSREIFENYWNSNIPPRKASKYCLCWLLKFSLKSNFPRKIYVLSSVLWIFRSKTFCDFFYKFCGFSWIFFIGRPKDLTQFKSSNWKQLKDFCEFSRGFSGVCFAVFAVESANFYEFLIFFYLFLNSHWDNFINATRELCTMFREF